MLPDVIHAIIESLGDPQRKHAMMVHMPIAISVLGLLGLLALSVTSGRSATLRWCCVAVYLLGAGLAWSTAEAGDEAMDRLDTTVMTSTALEHLETHEEMGEWVWAWFAATGVIATLTVIESESRWWRPTVVLTSVLAGAGAAVYTGIVSHHGGAMVYQHGVGVPTSPNNLKLEVATPPHYDESKGSDTDTDTDTDAARNDAV